MRLQHGPARRAGYTFVELLFVIAIVAILASLLLAAVQRVLILQARTETASDITQMQQSLNAAKAAYGNVEFLPSQLILYTNAASYQNPPTAVGKQTANAFRYMFGKRFVSNGVSTLNWGVGVADGTVLNGPEVLVFYLGGMRSATGQMIGFSTDPRNPTLDPANGGTERKGPYFQFKDARLTVGPRPQYRDPHGTPFAYFGAIGPNSYDVNETQTITNSKGVSMTLRAYFESGSSPTKWLNANSFQIISAGRDLQFGVVPGPAPAGGWNVRAGYAGSGVGADDLSNFSQTELGNGIE